MKYVKLFLIVIFLLVLVACNQSKEIKKEFIILTDCEDMEVLSDIEHSGLALEKYLLDNNITFTKSNLSGRCGYLLKNDQKEKYIESALTDVELMEICTEFYK